LKPYNCIDKIILLKKSMILESFVVYQFGQAHFEPCKIWAGPDLMWTNYLGPQTALYRPAHWSSALTKNKKNKSLAKSF